MPTDEASRADRRPGPYFILCGVATLIAAGLLAYSQTMAFAWDEGYHLVAAQLIKAGKRPYLDFVFPQTALNAYWNAFCMWVFGESWRTAHAAAALSTAGAAMLAADYVYVRLPVPKWRLAAALTAALGIGLNALVVSFGTLSQAYGFCLLMSMAAFRVALLSVDRKGWLLSGLAGLLAAAAAGGSLLTAPVAPVIALWAFLNARAGSRWAKLAAFAAGSVVAFLPILRLFVLSPRQVLFSVIEYQLLHRQVQWDGAYRHNFEVMISWIDYSHALILIVLAVAGLLFVIFQSGWDRARKAEFYLCAWLAATLSLHISTAVPTFRQYYLLAVPFAGILAAVGLYAAGSRVIAPERPFWPAFALSFLLLAGLGKHLYEEREDFRWSDIEPVARKVDQVTPRGGLLLADEQVYFLTRRTPPSGMELEDSHKLELPADVAEKHHILGKSELERRIVAGVFDTVERCDDDEETIERLGLKKTYSQNAEFDNCVVYWGKTLR